MQTKTPIHPEFSTKSYDYFLPKSLIASHPIEPKERARLLVYEKKTHRITHAHFADLFDLVPKDTLWVFNETKVIKARLFGEKKSGGKIEIFVHHKINTPISQPQSPSTTFLVQIKGRVREEEVYKIYDDVFIRVLRLLEGGFREIEFLKANSILLEEQVYNLLETLGHVPLPPYIKREARRGDDSAYQSVFAKNYGAVAAPTASLHFSESMAKRVQEEIKTAFLTLHVGAGTFINIKEECILGHKMHSEKLQISKQESGKIAAAKKILGIGTTSLRGIEYLEKNKLYDGYDGECDIFLHPGNPPVKTNFLLTNFHLPKSTLIVLVSSIIGLEECKRIYSLAIEKKYRFYSYGDGMIIL